jgi:glycerol-3-phosphate O-acyltransferase
MIPRDRAIAMTETTSRSLEWARELTRAPGEHSIDELINETLYFERQRLRGEVHSPGKDADRAFWKGVARTFPHASNARQIEILHDIIHRYADEIIGHFDPLVFKTLTRYGSGTLSLLLHSMSPLKLAQSVISPTTLDDAVLVLGEVEQFKALSQIGTLVLAPTHVSNLDSVVLGFALARLGLPPFLYGAGYNLFQNPLFAPWLKRLGAYTVDREKRAPLYKNVLKTYANVSMEMGYHHIFFPGGTRARSGRIERRLKKGLLGCGLQTYESNLRRKAAKPKVFVVPCTLTYQMVLEAETLIADHLAEAGKARYIIIDDESSRLERVTGFLKAALRHQSTVHMWLGPALDPFGNRVTADGQSVDEHGRPIDPQGYLMRDGVLVHDEQRNEEFTNELSEELTRIYPRGFVVGSTHIVSALLFAMLQEEGPGMDLYRLLRDDQLHTGFQVETVRPRLARLLAETRRLADLGQLLLDPVVKTGDADDVLARALVHFSVYHAEPAVQRRGTRVFVLNRALLYYYRNRLEGYPLGVGHA